MKAILDDRDVFWLKLMAIEAICRGNYDDALHKLFKLKENRELWERLKAEEADALRDCSKCKHFEDRGTDEYSCKYLREGKVVFQSDSTDTAESCPYYEEVDA